MTHDLEMSFTSLNPQLVKAIKPIVDRCSFEGTLSKEQFAHLIAATGYTESDLKAALLPLASAFASPAISSFSVGAIATGLSGCLYFGANVEFLGVPLSQSIHAEQSAIVHAWMKGESGIKNIAINYSPCGHCRQFMNELTTAQTLKIQLPETAAKNLAYYLPEPFGPKELESDRRLMDLQVMPFTMTTQDRVVNAALEAMNRSYAPYSHHYNGIALVMDDGELFQGSYAENAAFNPSMASLQVALVQVMMSGRSIEQVVRVVLVENRKSRISHQLISQEILNSYHLKITLEYYSID